jgi:hypothetical protein
MRRKSQLAIEFAYRTREHSPERWVIWVHASNASRFEQSYRDTADYLKIPGRNESKANIFKLVHDWLRHESKRDWLLILDNVDDARFLLDTQFNTKGQAGSLDVPSKPLREYLPQCQHGSILITSRSREAALTLVEQRDIIDVQPMNAEDALELFEKKLVNQIEDQGDSEEASNLIAALEFMPLAIVQAAAYISQRAPRCSVRKYLEDFERNDQKRSSLLNHEAGQLRRDRDAKNSIIITWQMSFDHIHQTRPSAADLLSLMSFFDRQGIPETVLRNRTEQQSVGIYQNEPDADAGDHDEDSSSQSSCSDEFEEDIMTLRNYSFITLNTDGASFKMHRLVQLAMRKWLEANSQFQKWNQQFLQNLNAEFPFGVYENWDLCQALYPHAKLALLQPPEDEGSLLTWSTVLHNAASYALDRGNWTDAERMFIKSMEARKKILGEEHRRTLASMCMLGMMYQKNDRPNEAEELLARGLEISSRVLGEEHKITLDTMGNLATTYMELSQWDKAEELHQQGMKIASRLFGEKDLSVLDKKHNLAYVYMNQGKWGEAEGLYVQVFNRRKRLLGEEHPRTLLSMAGLARTYRVRGLRNEGLQLLQKCVRLMRLVLGDNHPDTLLISDALAAWEKEHLDV